MALALTDEDREWVRDEIGTAVPPQDHELDELHNTLQSRTLVALRVLKRRWAAAAGGASVESFSLSGVLSVTKRTYLKDLRTQIERLEALYAAELAGGDVSGVGASTTHLRRLTPR